MTTRDDRTAHAAVGDVEALPAEDELAIRNLVARYHDAVCRSDADAWAATWAGDAQWHLGEQTISGRDAIVDLWKNTIIPPYESRIFQVLGHGRVWVAPGGAGGRWTFLDVGLKAGHDKAHFEACCYRDRYVRHGGRWVFAERRFSLGYQSWIDPGDFHGFPPLD
jgi:hypothetical protein